MTVDTKNGKGIYVPIERFEAFYGPAHSQSPRYFAVAIIKMRAAGLLKDYKQVYGFKKSWLERKFKNKTLGPGWVTLESVLMTEITNKLAVKGVEQAFSDYLVALVHQSKALIPYKEWAAAPTRTSIGTLVEESKRCLEHTERALFEMLNDHHSMCWASIKLANLKATVNFKTLEDAVKKDYPMLKVTAEQDKKTISVALDYVNLIESI